MSACSNLKRICRILIPAVLCMTMVFSTDVLHRNLYAADVSRSVQSDKSADAPDIKAESAVLYSENTGTVLYSKNAVKRVAPFSTTKLMTALLVVKHEKDLDRKVRISKSATELGGSTMFLKEGEVVTIRQLLYGLMINSGNDAAYSLAEAVSGGDIRKFVRWMNEEADKLGCKDTHFVNPNGMKADGHYTTAGDYIKVARAALRNKQVYKLAGTKIFKMDATNLSDRRVMKAHTDLLGKKGSGVVAGKTGFWDGEASIVLSYNKRDLSMLLVMFGDDKENRPKDAEALFRYARKHLKTHIPVDKGEKMGKVLVRGGKHTIVDAYASETAYAYTEKGDRAKIKVKIKRDWLAKAPLKAGDKVGVAKVYVDDRYTSDALLVVKHDVESGWLPSKLYISNMATIIIVAAIALLMLIRRIVTKHRQARASVRYMGKHDRSNHR